MKETAEDVERLQHLLAASYERGGAHLKSILLGDRQIPAAELCELLTGVQIVALATVNSRCEPFVSPVDGLFYKGVWYFGSSVDSVRWKHLRARPAASLTHARGEEMVVVAHGTAEMVNVADPEHAGFRALLIETYPGWEDWAGDAGAAYARLNARVMFASRLPGA